MVYVTLKLAIFSLYEYILRLINILMYETFSSKSKIVRNILVAEMQCFHHIHVPYAPDSIGGL
jgi:hypothetical protein